MSEFSNFSPILPSEEAIQDIRDEQLAELNSINDVVVSNERLTQSESEVQQ